MKRGTGRIRAVVLAGLAVSVVGVPGWGPEAPGGTREASRRLVRSSGEYLGHHWQIDANHLMWWDGKPYVPFGGFGLKPDDGFGLDTHNLWLDFDPFIEDPNYTCERHRRDVARRLAALTAAGRTCIVQFSMALPHIPEGPRPGMRWSVPEGGIDASRLADPEVRQAIFRVWADYAPAVRSECVRGLVLWNEINVWRWPERYSPAEYAEILYEYVREAKRLVGDLPVCFKAAGMWQAEPVIAAAARADGLGFDIWFSRPEDPYALREIRQTRRRLEQQQKKTSWFFIAEGGRVVGEDGEGFKYPDAWPPFRSEEEAREILLSYARAGVKGFIYNGPPPDRNPRYRDSYRWLGRLKLEIAAVMIRTGIPAEPKPPGSAAAAVRAARNDPRVQAMLRGLEDVRAEAEFADQWNVWLVRFRAGDRQAGFASVDPQGAVVEVGREEGDAGAESRESPPATDSPARDN
jgi:hypothetical protein